MATYYDQYISEIHPSKPKEGADARVSAKLPEGAYTRREASEYGATGGFWGRLCHALPDDAVRCAPVDPCAPRPDEGGDGRATSTNRKKASARPLRDSCAVDWGDLRNMLSEPGGGPEAYFDRAVGVLAELVDLSNMCDWHLPYSKGQPAPHQSCAKCARGAEAADNAVIYIGEISHRAPVREAYEVRRAGPSRADLFRIWIRRNRVYVNNPNPIILLTLLSNMDIQGRTSKYGAVSYMGKYITHHGSKSGPHQVAEEKELGACLSRTQNEGKGRR